MSSLKVILRLNVCLIDMVFFCDFNYFLWLQNDLIKILDSAACLPTVREIQDGCKYLDQTWREGDNFV